MSWLSRFFHLLALQFHSSTMFANIGTVLVSFLVTPMLDIAFSVLMGASLSAPDLVRIGYGSCLVGAAIGVCTTMAASVANDKDQEILQDVLLRRKIDMAYWLGVAVRGVLMAFVTGIIASSGIFLIDATQDWESLLRTLALLPMALVSGALLGIGVSGLGLPLKDSFMPLNTAVPLLPIIAGVVVPLRYYPLWAQHIVVLLPMSSYSAVLTGAASIPAAVVRETLTGGAWAVIGIMSSILAVRSWKHGNAPQAM